MRTCNYTYCNNSLEDNRTNKKFCCDNHRKMEGTLIKRHLKKKKEVANILLQYDKLKIDDSLLELYKKIYNK